MIELYMDTEGLAEFEWFLKETGKILDSYSGVRLSSIERYDSKTKNSDIMKYLNESGRAFDNMDTDDIEGIARAGVAEWNSRNEKLLKRMKNLAKKNARAAGKSAGLKGKQLTAIGKIASDAVTSVKGDEKWAKQTQAAMLKEAMKAFMNAVEYNIETQNAPGGVAPLSEDYAEHKRRTFGFETPIGKATGQLLENLDTSIASKNIKLVRKK